MSISEIKTTGRDAIHILRRDGIIPLLKAGLRLVNLNHRGVYYYFNYHYKRVIVDQQMADPFTVVNIDPNKIQRFAKGVDQWKHIGEVWEGDWDMHDKPLETSNKYRSILNRFQNETSWKKTDVYQDTIEKINNGSSYWNGCRTKDQLIERTEYVEELYKTIRDNGFKSQSELLDTDIRSVLLSGAFDRSKTDIAVAIGRDGEFLLVDGRHRLAIAHVLELDQIPVRIVVRHSNWQQIRETIQAARSVRSLSEQVKTYVAHPDIEPIVPNNINY